MSDEEKLKRLADAIRTIDETPGASIADRIYSVRESEGLGWEGPAVKAYSNAVAEMRLILKETP